jgi:hypothetical protein
MFFTKKSLIVLMFGVAIIFPLTENPVNAHGGRTNAAGCHNDRKNGGYHCHNRGYGNDSCLKRTHLLKSFSGSGFRHKF